LKAYQEFLSQTQAQELEKFRDIDTVTEEFVERFKAELAYNIPLDDLQDKRMFLKNLREFYLSRGSEASYKFIFKTFFNKDVEIFYPSRQMLRVSDGKWKQDVSIFVQNTSSTAPSLFPLSGNYISIDSGGKRLTSYVEDVVQYSNNIFEVFIQRDIVKSIVVGATISYVEDGITYSGNVLLTPRSIKVLRPGKGFRVGDIFNLRTNTGEGCKIKVTQVDGNGGIIKAKILKFSLDYSANFWSYLNAKDGAVIPPQGFSQSGNIQTLTIFDLLSQNINESGFISRQNYMFYDTNIPTGSEAQGANRFFADTTYVGQVDSQIYADNLIEYNPEDLALIEVQVGACSIYSGYYLAQDGFISDEIYIQDSNYYQAFSYVIKVEEELRKYADLVKTILHPAGMKMFAEFQIYNNINISATSIFKNRVIQISDSFPTFNQGIAYSDYDVTYDANDVFVHTPKAGASIILTPFNTLAHILGKRVYSPTTASTVDIVKFFIKSISVSYSIDEIYPVKLVEKPFAETSLIESNATKLVEKPFAETPAIGSSNVKLVEKPFAETPAIGSSNVKLVEKPFNESYVTNSNATKLVEKDSFDESQPIASSNTKLVEKPFTETPAIGSSNTKLIDKESFNESQPIESSSVKLVEKDSFDESQPIASSNTKLVEKPFTETLPIGSITNKNLDKALINEILSISSIPTKLFHTGFTSSISTTSLLLEYTAIKQISSPYSFNSATPALNIQCQPINSSYSVIDSSIIFPRLIVNEPLLISSLSNNSYQRALLQLSVTVSSSNSEKIEKTVSSQSNISDVNSLNFTRGIVNEAVILDDQFTYVFGPVREFSSQVSLASTINNKDAAKTLPQLTITTSSTITSRQQSKTMSSEASVDDSGVLKLNSYDSGDYFYPNAIDYQSDIISIT
jgi:hypothetical protein